MKNLYAVILSETSAESKIHQTQPGSDVLESSYQEQDGVPVPKENDDAKPQGLLICSFVSTKTKGQGCLKLAKILRKIG